MPSGSSGPSLPLNLLREIGAPEPKNKPKPGKFDKRWKPLTRKDRRKEERSQKRTQRSSAGREHANRVPHHPEKRESRPPAKGSKKTTAATSRQDAAPARPQTNPSKSRDEGSEEDGDDFYDFSEDDEDEDKDKRPAKAASVSKSVRDKLAQDDKEIAALEKKLGLKGRKSLPKSFQEDGLGDMLAGLDGEADGGRSEKGKRKAEADEWLAQKRRKAAQAVEDLAESDDSDDDMSDGLEGLGAGFDRMEDDELSEELGSGLDVDGDEDDEMDEDGSEDDDEEDGEDGGDVSGESASDEESPEQPAPPRKRENPYVAPTTNIAKYVPPSLRQEAGTDQALTSRLRRQAQGLVNRLTEANLVAILGDIEKLYRDNPRQHVTSILVDLLLVQITDPTSLPDTLLILTAGFATAVYKVIGMDFGAHLVQHTVQSFKKHYDAANAAGLEAQSISKETSNLITFISQLYTFQLVGGNLVFDYIRLLLGDLTELNAELLLRVIRMSGPLLRQDDPLALKDIVALIRPAMAKVGEANISVRTKFMIETMNDLKNNKMKAGANASAVVSEHTTRMKKLLGSLNARKLRSSEPLRIGVRDIEESDKRGKWWLVGASWAGKGQGEQKSDDGGAQASDSSDDESVLLSGDEAGAPDLLELAREQMMNTDVRRSIFVAVLSATDYEDACARVLKLRLNKDRQREIPNVLIQCAGAEQQHNPYYTLIARRLCSDRRVRWAFQDSLWKLFRRLGESIFGDEADDDDGDDDAMDVRRLVNIAKMYGSLVAGGALGLNVLKCLNMAYLQPKTKAFVEVMLITVMLEAQQQQPQQQQRKGREEADPSGKEAGLRKAFASVGVGAPELARSLQYFLRNVVRKSDLAGSKADAEKVARACKRADRALEATLASSAENGDEDGGDSA